MSEALTTMSNADATLNLRGVSRSFGNAKALDAITLAVRDGEMVAVLGRSGAGKSTLLNLINRLIDPTEGEIWCGERNVSQLRGRALLNWRRESAMIFQRFNLVSRLNVITNVLTGRLAHAPRLPKLLGRFTDYDRDVAIDALEALGMAEFALRRADELSGGQQQRVAIARALVQQPRIILADEPVASLDPVNSRAVMDALRHINRERGITILCNLHSVPLAREYCDRAVALAKGKLIYDGPVSGLDNSMLANIYGSDDALAEAH